MESYQTLYRLRVQHDYFEGRSCDAVGCRLSPQGVELARQRNLLLRQTAADEWAVIYDCNGAEFSAEGDILTLELYLADYHFMLYTQWQDFCPSDAYELELPGTEVEMDATKAIRPSEKRRGIGSGFCSVSLRLTNDMRQKSSGKEKDSTTLEEQMNVFFKGVGSEFLSYGAAYFPRLNTSVLSERDLTGDMFTWKDSFYSNAQKITDDPGLAQIVDAYFKESVIIKLNKEESKTVYGYTFSFKDVTKDDTVTDENGEPLFEIADYKEEPEGDNASSKEFTVKCPKPTVTDKNELYAVLSSSSSAFKQVIKSLLAVEPASPVCGNGRSLRYGGQNPRRMESSGKRDPELCEQSCGKH